MSYFSSKKIKNQGFTLIELMVVFAIVALLSSIAVPKYFTSLQKSRESVLRYDLSVMRESIDKYFSDNGSYPESLQQLVEKKYLKNIIIKRISCWAYTQPHHHIWMMGGLLNCVEFSDE